ncbi:uncharacterized protein MELLADRAFT_102205 [Melampsora larici-populina 98AG31]|uniref:Uncharacterized protein n=1 Tax=Melampsora larici-populina (strain 98AG31 / pathotype 3-4-7) TaxID=747676 RepID=F4R7I9_MELLP|nr:uncharacterized protein MELLADRAFT_102205 [Melampsora larici-populina 98AG31]EGG11778.1 hypothetical protein MELLADRAFT_102205 [Melampsora larici-populina 98AG31]
MPNGLLSDVGTKNEELWEQALADSKANNDNIYPDNPFNGGRGRGRGEMRGRGNFTQQPWRGSSRGSGNFGNGFGGNFGGSFGGSYGGGYGGGFGRGRGSNGTGDRPKIGPGSFDKSLGAKASTSSTAQK